MPINHEIRNERRAEYQRNNPIQTPIRKRHCINCDVVFICNPKHPDHKFCQDKCRKEFHRNGTAMGPVMKRIEQIVSAQIDRRTAEMQQLLTACEKITKDLEAMRKKLVRLKAQTEGKPKASRTIRR